MLSIHTQFTPVAPRFSGKLRNFWAAIAVENDLNIVHATRLNNLIEGRVRFLNTPIKVTASTALGEKRILKNLMPLEIIEEIPPGSIESIAGKGRELSSGGIAGRDICKTQLPDEAADLHLALHELCGIGALDCINIRTDAKDPYSTLTPRDRWYALYSINPKNHWYVRTPLGQALLDSPNNVKETLQQFYSKDLTYS
jgi:hypothetical protein